MHEVSDTYHLALVKGTYYYHRRVPTHLIEKAKTPVVRYSLRTKLKAQAKRRRAIEDQRTDKWFSDLEAGTAVLNESGSNLSAARNVSLDELIEHARAYVEDEDRRRAKRLLADPPQNEEERGNMLDTVAGEQEDIRRGGGLFTDRVASAIGERAGLGDQYPAALLSIASRALGELARRQGARLYGDYQHTHFDVEFAPRPKKEKVAGATLTTLCTAYLAEVKAEHKVNGVSTYRTEQVTAVLDYIKEAIGPNTKTADINDDVIQKVRANLARTPARRASVYPKLSLAQAIRQGEKDGRPTLSPLTQHTYIQILVHLMKFAVRKRFLAWNPAEGAKPLVRDTLNDSERRLPFSLDQLKAMYEGPYYQKWAKLTVQERSTGDAAWQYWLPLLLLFTSARPNEICQLFVHDVRQTNAGTWYLDCLREDEKQSRKTATSRRRIPLHEELIRLGFLDFVARRRKAVGDKEARLFDTLVPRAAEPTNFSRRPCVWLSRNFIAKHVPDLDKRQTLYSIRHSARDALRRAKAPPEALLVLGGWAPAGGTPVSSAYGDAGNPDLWQETVNAMVYQGVDLSFLHVASS